MAPYISYNSSSLAITWLVCRYTGVIRLVQSAGSNDRWYDLTLYEHEYSPWFLFIQVVLPNILFMFCGFLIDSTVAVCESIWYQDSNLGELCPLIKGY